MIYNPFDPKSPAFPWEIRPAQAKPPSPSLAALLGTIPPRPKSLLGDRLLRPKRPRIFVSYQHSSDQAYYDAFSKTFHDGYEAIYDNSLERRIDSDNTDYVIQRIRDKFITGTSCTLVIVGATSYQRKYLDWEIKATLEKEHGLIGVRLPTAPVQNGRVIVPARLYENIQSGFALWLSWEQVAANEAALKASIADACARPKDRIVNPKEIKRKNG